jgi:hypothetical protein
LNFCPSYRWKTGVFELSNKNGQAASWCDRVLLHKHQDFSSQCLSYASVPSIITSDHRPVYGLFRIECPVYDHAKLSPPFRIELSRVSMQLVALIEPSNALVDPSSASTEQPNALNVSADGAVDDDHSTPAASPARDSQRVDSQSAVVYTLGIRGNCIEGEARFLFGRIGTFLSTSFCKCNVFVQVILILIFPRRQANLAPLLPS